MANELVVFRKGLSSALPSEIVPGTLLAEIDTGNAFLDTEENDRVQLTDTRKLSLSGGTMTGPINMGGQKITNVGNPTENTDVANKIFVDTAFQTLESEMGTTLAGYLQLKGGTMTGVLDMGGHYIQNVETPQTDDEAANKGYVDGQVEGLQSTVNSSLNNYLPLSGGTLTGALTLSGNPSQGNHAANKAYVDSQISGLSSVYVPLSGGTLTGPLVLSGNPTQSNQAANKQYVDDTLADAVGGITGFEVDSNNGSGYADYEALTSAHPTGKVGTFYLVVNPDSSAPNAFDEYFWTGTGYEKAGGFGDVDTSDLATKAELAGYLPLSGGSLTGELNLPRNIKLNFINGTSSIQYTSNWLEIKTYVQGESIVLTGTDYDYQFNSIGLNLNSKKITGLATPTANSDAATKQYVDNAVADVQVPASVANQFLTSTAATTATKTITGTKPNNGSIFFVLFQTGVTASSGTFTFSFSTGGTCTVSGGSGFPTMPTIAIPAWTMGTFYMNSATTAKFIAYTNYIDDGVVS